MILTFILTERCDGDCIYCPQTRSNRSMSPERALAALERLLPLLADNEELRISFYGGEPLLEKETLLLLAERARQLTEKSSLRFAVTSNGSRLDGEFLERIEKLPFLLVISHDGLWHKETRPGCPDWMTLDYFETLLASHPQIETEYNCICPPGQIGRLGDNIRFFREKTRRPVHFGLDMISPWTGQDLTTLDTELGRIRAAGIDDACPDFFTAPTPGQFVCDSCNRISIDPDGFIWGCHEYYDLFRRHPEAGRPERHRTGHIDMPEAELRELILCWPTCEPHEQSQWMAGNEVCLVCDQFLSCRQCPVNGAYVTGKIGHLPPWTCAVRRILNSHSRPPSLFPLNSAV